MEKNIQVKMKLYDLTKIDELGRIKISEYRRKFLDINTGDKFEVYESGKNIILKKYPVDTSNETIDKIQMIINNDFNIIISKSKISKDIGKIEKANKEKVKSNVKVRVIDELGRLAIPINIRKNLKIRENDEFKIYFKDDMIVLINLSNIK